jgi:hypothetical protein
MNAEHEEQRVRRFLFKIRFSQKPLFETFDSFSSLGVTIKKLLFLLSGLNTQV